jgi:uracil-DNA glycosylase family 4
MARSSNSRDLARLAAEVHECRACPRLVSWREQVALERRAAYRDEVYWGRAVSGFGDPDAQIAIVGLAPAAHGANRTGRMFTGDRSGDWLFGALHRAGLANQPLSQSIDDGLSLRNAYVTSPVKCAPPANKPTVQERERCAPFLAEELELLSSLKVVVVLGRFGFEAMCAHLGLRPRPAFGHGVEHEVSDGPNGRRLALLCSYHVSQQNTFTGRLTEDMLDAIFERAKRLAASSA